MVVRVPGPDEAAALAALAAHTFADTFGAENTADDLAAHVQRAYSEPRQRAELTNPDYVTLVVDEANRMVAFAQVRRGSETPPCVAGEAPVEIWRFYVDREWHGRGIAQTLMRAALEAARELGGRTVWLSVWERNPRAMAFYSKCGFADAGSKDFVVGSDRQTDRVYVRDLGAAVSL